MSDDDIRNLVFTGYRLASGNGKANERFQIPSLEQLQIFWLGVTKYQKADGSVSICHISIPRLFDLDIENRPFRHTSSEE